MSVPTAVVTGCSRSEGLGFAVARLLAEAGFRTVLTAREEKRARSLAETLRADGYDASALALDLSNPDSVAATGAHLREHLDRLDVLVNNASTFPEFDVLSPLDADLDAVRDALEVDVLGPWALVQAVEPLLRQAPAARVVNVGSLAAMQLTAGLDLGAALRSPAHAMGKHLLHALTTTLAKAFADTGILVNAVDPGRMATHPERGDDDDSRTAADSARWVVRAATFGADGPSGQLLRDGEPVPILAAAPAGPDVA